MHNAQRSMFKEPGLMFDFEKLDVYQVVKDLNVKVLKFLEGSDNIDVDIKDQLKGASLSILLYLTEGTSRMTVEDKKHFYMIARGSVFESVAILDLLHEMELVDNAFYEDIYRGYEQASKMLLAMYRSMDKQ